MTPARFSTIISVSNIGKATNDTLDVSAADVLRLIQAHLTEAGLVQTVRTLQRESGIGLAGQLGASNLQFHASAGQWDIVLSNLSTLDVERSRISPDLLAQVHEMAILELAESNDLALAYATYRIVQHQLETSYLPSDQIDETYSLLVANESSSSKRISRARVLEQKLAALASSRSASNSNNMDWTVPADFYGKNVTRQERRDDIGRHLQDAVPIMPRRRLTTLLQQAIQWQVYTGQIPKIRRLWEEEDNDVERDQEIKKDSTSQRSGKKSRPRKEFDLVLGEVLVDEIPVGAALDPALLPMEPIPTTPFATIKFGKKAQPLAAAFLPDGSGLVTGSSDGLLEVWDASQNYNHLMPFPYQQNEELMGHDTAITALTVSNDGEMLVSGSGDGQMKAWRIASGTCVRSWQGHSQAISCIALTPDSTHVLCGSHNGVCREFGLRTTRVLKEFQHANTDLASCLYQIRGDVMLVITASGDGTVRLWDRSSQEIIRVLRPISVGSPSSISGVGASIVADAASQASYDALVAGSPAIHAVLPMHTPDSTMIVVPRGPRAFLVDLAGTVLCVYDAEGGGATDKVFVAATVSSTNQWFYAVQDDGVCCVFHVATSKLETAIRNLGAKTVRLQKEGSESMAELTTLLHHPNKSVLAAFRNSKIQKRGQIVLWK